MKVTNEQVKYKTKMYEVKENVIAKEMTFKFTGKDLKNLYSIYWEICRSGGVYWTGKRNPFTDEECASLENLMTEICKETDNVTNGSFPDMTPIDNK